MPLAERRRNNALPCCPVEPVTRIISASSALFRCRRQSGAGGYNRASMDKNDSMDFLAPWRNLKQASFTRSRHGESESGWRLSGCGVPEADQRQVQASDRLGPEGRAAPLWRD